MNNYQGKLLISTSDWDDDDFYKSVVFIAEHNSNGALGFIVNKIFERTLNELEEFKSSPAFPLFDGGPVDKEHLYFIHLRPDIISGGTSIISNLYLGGDFKETIRHINSNRIAHSDIKIFIGYCGWDANELETEIADGGWIVKEKEDDVLFGRNQHQ